MPVDDPDNYVGKVVAGKYRVEAMIGEGGMGRVFRANQLNLEKPVVLKVLRQNLLSDERTVERFKREAKAASRLNHPNSISVLDWGTTDLGALYIAMEYVSGRDLHQILSSDWPIPEGRVVRIISQVLSALADAHRAGVIHRDLKPENIMVEPKRGGEVDFVKVLDFGIAKIQDATGEEGKSLTRAGFVCGTPEYMSPEQARGMSLDARSDLYAVGVILYQLTTGVLPFEAENAVGYATKHLTEHPKPPSQKRGNIQISQAMERLILKALNKSPTERPQTADAFKMELVAVERERQAEQAQRLGRSSSVLDPLPSKAAQSYSSSADSDASVTKPPEPSDEMDARPQWGSEETDITQTEPGEPPAGRGMDVRESQRPPPPRGPQAQVRAAPRSQWQFRLAVIAVVLFTIGVGSLLAFGLWGPKRAASDNPSAQATAEPVAQGGAESAQDRAEQGKAALKVGNLALARQRFEEAFNAGNDPSYSLLLGALYFEDMTLDAHEREDKAKEWWRRHLGDHDDAAKCKARAQITRIFPDLAQEGVPGG